MNSTNILNRILNALRARKKLPHSASARPRMPPPPPPPRPGRPLTEVIKEIEGTLSARIDKLEQAVGVLINEPTPEQLERHKTLKDAYNRYKFVEGLILGDENERICD